VSHLTRFVRLGILVCPLALSAPLSLNQAVEGALKKYPAVRVSLEQVSSAAAGINLARASYLPRADLLGQINRATRNNVFGLLLPQSVLPSISGPVLGANSLTNVWGSAVGVLVSWEPFDFGLRKANVQVAEAERQRAQAAAGVTELEVATAAADAFLTILAAQETVRAAQASVERAGILERAVGALVKAELRPGAEAARARAERAVAETQLIQAEQAATVARASLGQLLGVAGSEIAVAPGRLLELPLEQDKAGALSYLLANHPVVREQSSVIDEVKARERALDRSYFPRFNLQGTTYARGTGARTDGATGGPFAGFGPNIQNWALGLTVTFLALDLPSLRARRQVEAHRERAETARYEKALQDLAGQLEKARATLDGERRVAQNTPVQLEAARATEQQATARYKAALGTIVEVADAERLLTQAEIDDSLARLNVWRALLAMAAAQGDLGAFLQQAGR
jgi:outer membrane protein TolC